MNTFVAIAVTVTSLFVVAALVIDHIEVNRYVRLLNDPWLQQWKQASEEERTLTAYLAKIGVSKDAPIEEIVQAQKQHENIMKILKTM